jgi:glycosyltransferase involved in cell wall biosynthesis
MRAAVVCDWFLKYASAQAVALQRHGVATALVCRDHAHEFAGSVAERDELLAQVRAAGVDVMELRGRVASPSHVVGTARLRRRLAAWRPDIVHAHDNSDPGLLAVVAGRPRVVTVHDPRPHPGAAARSWRKRAIRRRWLDGARTLVVHGERLRSELAAATRHPRIAVIPHGADLSAAPFGRPPAPRVLFFGRLEPYKGLPVLLEAIQDVWRRGHDVPISIRGAGPEAALVPQDPRIECIDRYVPEDALDDVLREASLVVLPYIQASQSGVGAFALGRGVPVLVTDVGSLPDLAADASLVVPPGDATALADAIVAHASHDDVLRARAWERARRLFAWPAVTERAVSLYESVLAAGVR